jgi:hypothetical protein
VELHHWIGIGLTLFGFLSGLLVNGITIAVKVTRSLSDMESRLKQSIMQQRDAIDSDIELSRRETTASVDTLRGHVGELGAALRTKIHEVETWARDTFVRRDSFQLVVQEIKSEIKQAAATSEQKLERIEQKLDKLQQR